MSDNTFIAFGGVKLYKSQVANMRTQICKDPTGHNPTKVYIVEFKSGVKALYTETPTERGGVIAASIDSSAKSWGDTTTNAYGVWGLELKGTKHMDTINITGGSLHGVDVVDGAGGDNVTVTDAHVPYPELYTEGLVSDNIIDGGRILTDSKDNTQIKNVQRPDYTRKGEQFYLAYPEDRHLREGVSRLDL